MAAQQYPHFRRVSTVPRSPRPKKGHSAQKTGIMMLSFFIDYKEPLLNEWLQQNTTVNAEVY